MADAGNDPKFPKKADGTRDIDTDWTVAQTWEQMEAVHASGQAKAIGVSSRPATRRFPSTPPQPRPNAPPPPPPPQVSNFSIPFLDKLLQTAKVIPAANQIELHPYLPQHSLLAYLASKGILAEAYSPLGSTDSPLLRDDAIVRIAEARGVSVGTVLISYQVARGVVVLPKSVTESRIKSNLEVVELSEGEMEVLNGLYKTKGQRFIKPDWGIDLGFDDWKN